MRRSHVIVLAVLLAQAHAVGAQLAVGIGPVFGYYRPLGKFDPASVYETDLPTTPQDLSGFAWGAAAHVWFGGRVGAEVLASVAHSTVPSVTTPEGPSPSTPAQVQMVMLQGLLALSARPSGHRLWLSAGPAVIRHAGAAYDPYDTPTQVAAAVGAGASVRLRRHMQASCGLDALLYTFNVPLPPELSRNPGSLEHGRQVDALLHVGISWTLGGT